MNAFERQVAEETVRAMGPIRPVDDLAIFDTASAAAPRWRLGSMLGATRSVVAGIVVALFGGILVAGLTTFQGSDEGVLAPGAAASPGAGIPGLIELPGTAPDGVESGVLDTPLGPARWVRLEGDTSAVPAFIDPHPAPGGFITLTWGEAAPGQRQQLWRSSDLVTWTPQDLSDATGVGQLTVADGVYWLVLNVDDGTPAIVARSTDSVTWEPVAPSGSAGFAEVAVTDNAVWVLTSEPLGLWRSTDTTAWQQIDLSGIQVPFPASVEWSASLAAPASHGDIDIVSVDYQAVRTDELLGLSVDGGDVDLRETAPGVYAARDHTFEPWMDDAATLRFEEVEGGLQVIDASDGTVLTRIDEVGMEFIERSAAREFVERRFGVVDGSGVKPIEVPSSDRKDATVFGTAEGLFAFLPAGYLGGPTRVWRSSDGSTWIETDPLPDEVGPNGIKAVWVDATRSRPVVTAWIDGSSWRSSDGVAWAEVPTLRGGDRDVDGPSYPGWMGSWYLGSVEMEPLTDAVTQLAFETLTDLAEREGRGGGPVARDPIFSAISPNTFTYSTTTSTDDRLDHDGQKHDIWIVTFDDLPT